MPAIGANILRARLAAGMSQEELARRVGYKSRSSINKIEKGHSDFPQAKVIEFANVLGTTPAALLGLLDEESQKKNDDIAGIVVRLRESEPFREAVKVLFTMSDELLSRKSSTEAIQLMYTLDDERLEKLTGLLKIL